MDITQEIQIRELLSFVSACRPVSVILMDPLLLLATKSIIQFIVVIEQFGLWRYASISDVLTMRWRNKKLVTKNFHFYCWQQIFVHNSGKRCDRTVRFAALCNVFRCAYDEMEK